MMDEATFNQTYATHRAAVYGLLRRRGVSEKDAPDAEQLVWLKVWRRGIPDTPYILRIARSVACDFWRHGVYRNHRHSTLMPEIVSLDDAPEPSVTPDPLDILIAEETLRTLMEGLDDLNKYVLAGILAERTIEEEMENVDGDGGVLKEQCVKTRRHRLRGRLRNRLATINQ